MAITDSQRMAKLQESLTVALTMAGSLALSLRDYEETFEEMKNAQPVPAPLCWCGTKMDPVLGDRWECPHEAYHEPSPDDTSGDKG